MPQRTLQFHHKILFIPECFNVDNVAIETTETNQNRNSRDSPHYTDKMFEGHSPLDH